MAPFEQLLLCLLRTNDLYELDELSLDFYD